MFLLCLLLSSLLCLCRLQLLSAIVDRYPRSLSEDEHGSLLSSLQLLTADCKDQDVVVYLLRAVVALTNSLLINCQTLDVHSSNTSTTVIKTCDLPWSLPVVRTSLATVKLVSTLAQRYL